MARKRKAGDGTVRQRKDGRWEGRIVIGYDDNGYPKTKNVLAKTKKECVEKLQKLKEECGGLKPEKVRSEMPFGDWLTYWYENHSKPKIRPTTQETYESRIRLHIIPEIGNIPLNKLTQNDLQQFYGRLKKSGRKRFTDKYGEGFAQFAVFSVNRNQSTIIDRKNDTTRAIQDLPSAANGEARRCFPLKVHQKIKKPFTVAVYKLATV